MAIPTFGRINCSTTRLPVGTRVLPAGHYQLLPSLPVSSNVTVQLPRLQNSLLPYHLPQDILDLGPTLIRTLVPRSSPNIPTSPFTTHSNSQTEGLECPRACPRALSIKCLGLAFSTKASSTTLGYLVQSLTLGHSTACFLFCLHTVESRWRDH